MERPAAPPAPPVNGSLAASDPPAGFRPPGRPDVARASDCDLVCRIGDGCHDSLAEAYSRHGESVRALAGRVCGRDGAADVTQDVFLGLWRAPERFDGQRGSLGTFLRVQAYGRAVDVLRSDTARHAREVANARAARAHTGVDEVALARSAADDVVYLLNGLADVERDAIGLAFFGGYTYRQVAELLRLPEGTVKSRIRTGLGRLRVALSAGAGPANGG